MARVTGYSAIDLINPQSFLGYVLRADSASIVISDGVRSSVYGGYGFQYSGDRVVGGVLTSYQEYYGNGLVVQISEMSLPATTVYAYVQSGNLPALIRLGLSGSDAIIGSPGDDYLHGYGGNDILGGGRGNDYINGGDGKDVALFSGPRSNYSITNTQSGIVVADKRGSDGVDLLVAVEHMAFSDFAYNLTIASKAASVPEVALKGIVDLYIAYFNRIPEADGLGYWIDQYKAGMSLDVMAKQFYADAITLGHITGYSHSMPLRDYIVMSYQNVLGRTGDLVPAADVDWWVNEISSGRASRDNLPARFISDSRIVANDPSQSQKWGWMKDYLDNRVEVGVLHAVTYGMDYLTQADAHSRTVAITKLITPGGIDAAVAMIGVGADNYII